MSGIVIFDATCIKHLESRSERDLIRGSLRAAGLTIYPTVVNLAEATKGDNERVASRAYDIIADLAKGVGLLPIPQEILAETGKAFLAGDIKYTPELYPPEVALSADGAIASEFREAARAYTTPFDRGRTSHFSGWRAAIQRRLREKRVRFSSADEFLDRVWDGSESQDTYARLVWAEVVKDLSYPGLEQLLQITAWRAFLGAEGHAVY
jgi:hypothetical protein